MEYALLIYENEAEAAARPDADKAQMSADYGVYTKSLVDAGVMKSGNALQPTPTATTVRVRDGETLNADGPFAETKEQFGGYYVIDCNNIDEALAWAAKVPSAKGGSVDVRPVMVFDQ